MKFVVRLLDADNTLLAWTTVMGVPDRGYGGRASCPIVETGPTRFVVERDGIADKLTVHWTDLDIARVRQLDEPVRVQLGQTFTFTWIEPVWLVAGMRDVPLPPVTVRANVSLNPPTAQMGVKTLV